MATTTRFSINGLVDTKQSALTNLEQICTSAGAWLTFDNQSGTWSVVINQAGNSISSFNNSNILNGIRMNGSGLRDLYNGVKVNYPRNDIRDNTDFVQIELPAADRNANEVDNLLEVTLPMVSTQVQAQLIGFRELKQSRVDRIVEFETDYTKIGLKAGDLIDITNEALDMSAEVYRITNIVEVDDAEQGLTFKITALQYDADVYNEDDLVEYTITTENGIYTAGDIAQPATPSITKYEKDGRPRLEIETIVPAGRVEAMEYWLATGNIANNYSLIGTQKSTTVGVLTEGDEIVLDLDNINAANVFVKTRGINSLTSGPFSNIGNAIFTPTQVTNAIGNSTGLLDGAGASVPTLLALQALLKGLDTYMNGNSNLANAVGSQISSSPGSRYEYNATIGNTNVVSQLNAMTTGGDFSGYNTTNRDNRSNWISLGFSLPSGYSAINIDIKTPTVGMSYTTLDQNGNSYSPGILAQAALKLLVLQGNILANATIISETTSDWTTNYAKNIVETPAAGDYWIAAYIIPTYDLTLNWPGANRAAAGGNFSTAQSNEIYFDGYTIETNGDASMDFILTIIV